MNTKVEECSFEEIEKVLAEKPELMEMYVQKESEWL